MTDTTNPHAPLHWSHDRRADTYVVMTEVGTYRVAYSAYRWVATINGSQIGTGTTDTEARNTAQLDYNSRRRARQTAGTVIPTSRVIAALRREVDLIDGDSDTRLRVTTRNVVARIAIELGIDPADLDSPQADRP